MEVDDEGAAFSSTRWSPGPPRKPSRLRPRLRVLRRGQHLPEALGGNQRWPADRTVGGAQRSAADLWLTVTVTPGATSRSVCSGPRASCRPWLCSPRSQENPCQRSRRSHEEPHKRSGDGGGTVGSGGRRQRIGSNGGSWRFWLGPTSPPGWPPSGRNGGEAMPPTKEIDMRADVAPLSAAGRLGGLTASQRLRKGRHAVKPRRSR